MQIKKVEEKPMQIHVKEKIKDHKVEKSTSELQDGKVKLISKTRKTDYKVTGKGNMVAEHKLKEQKGDYNASDMTSMKNFIKMFMGT